MTAPSGFRLGIDFGTTHTVASLQRPDGRVAGGLPAQTVLTYPAGWAETRRGVLADAAARAGMGTVSLVAEPLAAAAYFSKTPVPPGSALVVYDFGAGTFDVSVIGREPDGSWRVIANEGLDDVGGLDLDAAIVDHIRTRLAPADPVRWQQLVDATTTDGRRGQWQLLDEARAAKEQLSRTSLAAVRVPGFETDVHVTREEFEAMARPWLERTVALTAATLFGTELRRDQVAAVLLVGGSTRIPLVATMLHQRLGIAPTVLDQPELVVAEDSLASVPADPVPALPALPAPPAPAAPPAAGRGAADAGLAGRHPLGGRPAAGSPGDAALAVGTGGAGAGRRAHRRYRHIRQRGRQPARQQRHQPGRGQCATAERDGAGRGPDERRTPRHLRGDGERIGQLRRRHVRR